jgi:hypothetical protein
VMIRPVRCRPVATASVFGTPASCASFIRVRRCREKRRIGANLPAVDVSWRALASYTVTEFR